MAFEWLNELTPEQRKEQLQEYIEKLEEEIKEHEKQVEAKAKELREARIRLTTAEQEIDLLEQQKREELSSRIDEEEKGESLEVLAKQAKTEEAKQEGYEGEPVYEKTDVYQNPDIYKQKDLGQIKESTDDEYRKTQVEKMQSKYK